MGQINVAGKFRLGDVGEVGFAFGKYCGRSISEVARVRPRDLQWVLTRPFLDDVHDLVRAALAARAGAK